MRHSGEESSTDSTFTFRSPWSKEYSRRRHAWKTGSLTGFALRRSRDGDSMAAVSDADRSSGRSDLDAAESIRRVARERRLRVRVVEHVDRFVPRAAQDVAFRAGGIQAPLFHVAGHVGRAAAGDAARRAGREQRLAAEVARRHHVGAQALVGRAAPVIDGRQRLAGPARIRGRFVPAHAGDRIVVLSGDVRAHLPRRGARPPCRVAELRHRGVERQRPAVLQERLAPQLRAPVSAVVHEPLERAVRDLVAIDPVVRQVDLGKVFERRV